MGDVVVCGSNFGDCGKGHITEYFASLFRRSASAIVVRNNGGAQAGHTVIGTNLKGDPQQHIFSHVGSGALVGAATYLADDFICERISLEMELDDLFKNFAALPMIVANSECRITTGFDIYLNRVKELQRGAGRHGSCGLGINETVNRNLQGPPLRLADIRLPTLSSTVQKIHEQWFLPQIKEICKTFDLEEHSHLLPNVTVDKEIALLKKFPELLNITSTPLESIKNKRQIIYENAQGLMLDEALGEFPYVTRSITGAVSAIKIAPEGSVIHPVYVTRSYLTRHGAGPLLHEGEFITHEDLRDTTNKTGDWQGHFRYAPLDIGSMMKFILRDFLRANRMALSRGCAVNNPSIALTHADKIKNGIMVYDISGNLKKMNEGQLIDELRKIFPVKLISYGPHYSEVHEC